MHYLSQIKHILYSFLFLGLFFFPVHSFAFTVSPLIIDHNVEKRDIISETITLHNDGNSIIRLYPTVNEIKVDEGGVATEFIDANNLDRTDSITTWIQITRARIELKPGETKEIPLTIKMNPNTVAGEYHAFIGFPAGSNRPDAEARVMKGNAKGTMLRLSVDKVQNQFLRLEHFSVERFVIDKEKGSVNFTLKNPGTHEVVPSGEIIFYNGSGFEVGSTPVNPENESIGPDKSKSFSATIPEELALGKFKAFLSVEYGEHLTASVHDTAFFYVLPLKQLIIIFIVVLIVSIGLALYVHRKYASVIEDDGTDEVPMYLRSEVSDSKDHDIDLSKKNDA